eukprot:TRINITY_DN2027_c0_g1_i2.p1 TRINITY_DN2027_c0_g1~~TRINITY_DN2027_c0_g1_i2.p1  ORF type:complete len:125 (-),score=34.97 TRINITY_DN2027_c0_g1_i2:80-454(-)
MCIRDSSWKACYCPKDQSGGSSSMGLGIATEYGSGWIGQYATDFAYYNDLGKRTSGGMDQYGGRFEPGDVFEVELDLDEGTLRFKQNEKDLGIAFDNVKVPRGAQGFYATYSFDADFMCWQLVP